ncbi:IS110 family transposase [Cohnella laeviribosi]|uniref:IS110 family transposase n=1 Tax=Cohnella laeviribosi TaxID=380174 RepID=UPI003D1CF132
MKDTTKYVGLDVSKEKISVAIADSGREPARYFGVIAHRPETVRRLLKKLGTPDQLELCYEARPTGFELYRWITAMGYSCTVIAPSHTPSRPGDQVKTDRRDSERLAQLFRAGELTAVHIPSREDEALRDLIRLRADAKEDLHRCRQRIIHFLLRRMIQQPAEMKRRWSKKYREWLEKLTFDYESEQLTFQEYLYAHRECEERLKRVEAAMVEQALKGTRAEIIQAVQALRGIALTTAITIVAEIGSFRRFRSPAQLLAYLGMVPRKYSSGQTVKRGSLTKTGNRNVRRVFIEAAWSYRHRPAVKGELAKRLENQNPEFQSISWKAQYRLHNKYLRLLRRGKHSNLAIAAVARELVGFVWAVACEAERRQTA